MKVLKYTLILFLIFLSACSGEENIKPDDTIDEIDNPETVAVAFFDAIYNEKNIEK